MKMLQHVKSLIGIALLSISTLASADNVTLKELGVSFDLPATWSAKYREEKLPTGQLMQNWSREAVTVGKYQAAPGLVVVVSPVESGANLSLLTQKILGRAPYGVKLAVETECLKCVRYQAKVNGQVVGAIAPDAPPNCTPYQPGVEADCLFQAKNLLNLQLEPSWVHRFEKAAAYGKSFVLVVHAIVDGKLLDMSFIYPREAAQQIEPEIGAMVASIKKTQE